MTSPVNRFFPSNELDRVIPLLKERCRNRSPRFMETYYRTLFRSAKARDELVQFMKKIPPKKTTLTGKKTSDNVQKKTDARLGSIKIRTWEDLCKMDPSKFNPYDPPKSVHTTKPLKISLPLTHFAVRKHMDQIGAANLYEPEPIVNEPYEPVPVGQNSNDSSNYTYIPTRYIVSLSPNHPIVLEHMDQICSANRYICKSTNTPNPTNKSPTLYKRVGSIGAGKLFQPVTVAKNSKDLRKFKYKPTPIRCVVSLPVNHPVVRKYLNRISFGEQDKHKTLDASNPVNKSPSLDKQNMGQIGATGAAAQLDTGVKTKSSYIDASFFRSAEGKVRSLRDYLRINSTETCRL